MPITLDQIAGLLDKIEVKYQKNEEREALEVTVTLEKYRDSGGENSALVVLRAGPGGQSITAFAPALYTIPEGPTALSVYKALSIASRQALFVKYVMDDEDNSVDALGTLPVANSKLTPDQFRYFLADFPTAIDYFHSMIQHAIETGEIVEPDPEESTVDSIVEEIRGLDPESLIQLREALDAYEKEEESSAEKEEL